MATTRRTKTTPMVLAILLGMTSSTLSVGEAREQPHVTSAAATTDSEPVTPDDGPKWRRDVPYLTTPGLDDYARERCRLDIYLPGPPQRDDADGAGLPVVVWFHAGGLTGGSKSVPAGLVDRGVIVIAANYRLSPRVEAPVYLQDAAAATAWAFRHAAELGGSRERIFVAGHSAGGYLASMIGLDQRWLGAHQIDANELAGMISLSGHAVTHFTVRRERGMGKFKIQVDDLAPLNHVRKDAPAMLLVTGDRNREILGRYEETAYLWRMLTAVGHNDVTLHELGGYDHGGMAEPAMPLLLRFIRRLHPVRP